MVINQYRFNKIILLTLPLIVLVFLFGCSSESNPEKNISRPKVNSNSIPVIQQGTKVEDLDISGVTFDEAEKLIDKWQKPKLEQTIMLDCNKSVIPVSLLDLGAKIDKGKILSDVKNSPGQTIRVMVHLDSVKANKFVKDKLEKFNQRSNKINEVLSQIDNQPLNQIPKRIKVTLVNNTESRDTVSSKASSLNGIIGEFSTKYSSNEKNRTANLVKAAKALSQKKVYPGNVFSFNDTVGERTQERGYKNAKIIKENQYVKDTGGGVCQVASTLYSAVILANLQVIERKPHEVPITYIPLGQDATVYYPNVDFKFKNNTDSPLYIRTSTNSGKLTVQLYGKKTDNKVKIKRQIEKVIRGQAGAKGYVVNTWKVVTDAQGHVNKTFLSRDVYEPLKRK